MDLNNRMVCYNISKLGQGLKKLVMSNVQKHIWQRTAVNRYAVSPPGFSWMNFICS